jgi:hypothetical protein
MKNSAMAAQMMRRIPIVAAMFPDAVIHETMRLVFLPSVARANEPV